MQRTLKLLSGPYSGQTWNVDDITASSSSSSSSLPPVPQPPGPTPPGPIVVDPSDQQISTTADLLKVLALGSQPGKTYWLRGGKYAGNFISKIKGTASAPVTLRGYPGEDALLTGPGNDKVILTIAGDYSIVRDIRVDGLPGNRLSKKFINEPSYPTDLTYGSGIELGLPDYPVVGAKVVNCDVANTQQGFSLWAAARDIEIYGCSSRYNGWDSDHGHGHGLYGQADQGYKTVEDSIFVSGFAEGIQIFGKQGPINNISILGNLIFNNGELCHTGIMRNLLVGGGTVANNPAIQDNGLFYPGVTDPTFNLGYFSDGKGSSNATVQRNIMPGRCSFQSPIAGLKLDGNVIGTPEGAVNQSAFPSNRYGMPTSGLDLIVRANKYERGRGHVGVFNWGSAASVKVDIGSLGIKTGETFNITFAGNPRVPKGFGTYTGQPIIIPMSGWTMEAVGGTTAKQASNPLPRFGAFIIRLVGA